MKLKMTKKGIKKPNISVTKRKKSKSKVSKDEYIEQDLEDNDSKENNDRHNGKTGVYILSYIFRYYSICVYIYV